jgi:ribosomal protein S27AE
LIRPDTCSKCGESGYIVAHHHDYDKPLDVIWLCLRCDRQLHADLKRKAKGQDVVGI